MAAGSTDFGSDAVGSTPAGWTDYLYLNATTKVTVETLAGSLSGQALKLDSGGQFNNNLSALWTGAGQFTDGDVLVLARLCEDFCGPILRGDASGADWNALVANREANDFAFRYSNVDGTRQSNYPAYFPTNVQDSNNYTALDTGDISLNRRWIRANFDGTAVKARVWAYGDPEPETWNLDGTLTSDAVVTETGYVGFFAEVGGNLSFDAAWLEYIAYSDDPATPAASPGSGGGGGSAAARPLTKSILKALPASIVQRFT